MTRIITGLFLLGIVVFIHELGHFIAARFCGVKIETFSLGWGPVLLRKKIGYTEYRLSALPMGGYCGMKGENAFREALEKNLDAIPIEKDSFYGVHPIRRIIISFSGPLANLLFAFLALSLVSAGGTSYKTYDNRIVPASIYNTVTESPIDIAGLVEGDRILSLNDKKISTYMDIQQYISIRPQETIQMTYDHDGQTYSTTITPLLDKKTGVGKIEVYPYVPLVIGKITEGSAADTTGLLPDDVVMKVNGIPVSHFLQFSELLDKKPEQITITVLRDSVIKKIQLVMLYDANGLVRTGIEWETLNVKIKGTGFLESMRYGFFETGKTLFLTFKSIGLLFKGVSLSEAVSGPIRITMMIGDVAQTGFSGLAEFMSIICVSLFIMNLLPIPILDGGLILFSFLELVFRKPFKPKTLYYVQFIGVFFILSIFLLSIFGDIRFLMK